MATPATPPNIATLITQLANALTQAQQPSQPATRNAPNRVLLTVEEAAEQLGVGRTLMFRLIRRGEIESVQVGRLRRVHVDTVHEYAKSLLLRKSA